MFVTFEGADGAGKSSALASVAAELSAQGHPVFSTREPGAGEFGAEVRRLLLGATKPIPEAELFLFLADRAQHIATIVRPALARGEIVLCDRHADSTLVYQAIARGLDEPFVRAANSFATGGLRPDLTLLFDVDIEEAQSRLKDRDRIDDEDRRFHDRVREGFRRIAAEEPDRILLLDSRQPASVVANLAREAILSRLMVKR